MKTYNFGGGSPDPGSFPSVELASAATRILPQIGHSLVLYPDSKGYLGLREVASLRFYRREGAELPPDNIVLTTGSMQAISLITQTFVNRGEPVITEEFTYSGTLRAFRHYGADIVGIPLDEDGMRMDELEGALSDLKDQGKNPKFIYTIGTNQNPTGSVMPLGRRKELLDIARNHDVMVVEDNCYGDLRFEGENVSSLYAMDDTKSTLYLASFSKIMGPGIRLGYFAASEEIIQRIISNKIDGGTTALASCILAEYLKENLWTHIKEVCGIFKGKRDVMFQELEETLGGYCTWSRPTGGLFIWIKLPESVDISGVEKLVAGKGINCPMGRSFYSKDEDINYVRLSFGYPSHDDIREGVRLLAECIRASDRVMV